MSKNQAISSVLNKSGRYIKKYSPVALSCIASVGVVVTAVVAVKATPKALIKIQADSRKNWGGLIICRKPTDFRFIFRFFGRIGQKLQK